ncbi:MAG: hypothetical protein AB2814_02230 [Candidatus Sedimenticola endophacoides]|uniref:Uncharacterized protein n=1 Tax=Candidatus Sedimenticola endophacoides TaxID=2548426 RepID=A0A6N4DPA6_9GAMM|nr:MAG: hypothetical protein B0D94_09705 [Candidatus Sedimenticola endophacoides]OQX32721.1 MAG: hypothetical protein B0D96_13145 [Candidatus Sedimenticola endophacoides]OQX42756.1 MAG: hypothetical protein B0D89_00580 [Candidatus Sedimenticola endophacoides]OQX44219.1 MAG: hypothetical protein B0D86_06175 [Candidatus Sedimenticola endophacoides]PUE00181.1 MAG: hypothetical protein C3L24_09565 [Candidatus Sedimenticola endophacoides]
MSDLPRKRKHWAKEALQALDLGWELLYKEYPQPNEEQKLELVSFAPMAAGLNRAVDDEALIQEAYLFTYERLSDDLLNRDPEEPVLHSVLFLLAYLDAHISFGLLSERRADEIMAYISEHCEIRGPALPAAQAADYTPKG